MIYAFDTYYFNDKAQSVCIGFDDWGSTTYSILKREISPIEDEYVSGQFYKRELPCILRLSNQITLKENDVIVIDGYVVLNDDGKPGLGGHLFQVLGKSVPIIGVAKNNFATLHQYKREVRRGQSKKPLYVTAMGLDLEEASENIRKMAGNFRMPDLLKELDRLTREVF